MPALQVEFGRPEHGWIEARLLANEVVVQESVSDVPTDSLASLVSALIHMANGVSEASVTWHLEPEEWAWSFQSQGDEVCFRATSAVLPEFEVRLPQRRLLQTMMVALTRLRADPAWEAEERAWSWPFPDASLQRLRALIR